MENQRCWAWARFAGTFAFFVIFCGSLGEGTKLQNSIWSEYPISSKSMIRNDEHLHKPYFSDCSEYNPIVKEEGDANTFVIQVHADDQDPPDQGGTITYSFEVERHEGLKFEISNVTGVITTTQSFDRDEPTREKEFWLTVVATDNGHIRLSDMCTFKVTIEDVNDNAPVFDEMIYMESVPKDLHVGSVALTISATDIDDGDNSIVKYELDFENEYFKVNAETGDITLIKSIDKEPGYIFKLYATARDMGEKPKFSYTIQLNILVVESHKKAPSFTRYPLEPILIPENFSDFDEVLAQLEAESNIDDKPKVKFELLNGGTEQTNEKGTFKINSTMSFAEIRLTQVLDYEQITEYTLIVRVTNSYNLAAETKVIVKVLDVNDDSPVFRNIKAGTVLENEPPGVRVTQVHATDADGTFEHNQVTYKLANHQDLFSIDRKTGIITTLKELDRETVDVYNLKIVAIDSSPSANSKSGEHNSQERIVRIEIADKNDNPPQFTQSVYTALSILENASINTLVIQLNATDIDTASIIHYSIISGNTDESFFIAKDTGKISVNNYLDYENQTEYNLTVLVSDGKHTDTAIVIIFIENVNDNPPQFEDFDINPTIKEETPYNETCLTTVKAYDPDIQDRNADQHIVYSIINEDVQSFFDIDELGCMTLKKPLDRDSPNGRSMWSVIVKARDEDGGRGFLQSLIEVNITLIDINDNAPVFRGIEAGKVPENESIGVPIIQVHATDADGTFEHNQVTYKLANHQDLFSIDRKTGIITTSQTLDREKENIYDLKIIASDSSPSANSKSGEHNSQERIVRIEVADKNDNPPQFTQSVYTALSILENANINTLVIQLNATDVDTASIIHYSIISGNTDESFFIAKETGKIHVNHPLDYETHTEYNLTVLASDGKHTDTAIVIIFIENVNDNPPQFEDFDINPTIKEETPYNETCLTTVKAYDPDIQDRKADQHIVYSIINEDVQSFFDIDELGCMTLKKPLDRDLPNGRSMWSVIVKARDEDGGRGALRSLIEVDITLIDINDNAPVFEDIKAGTVLENKPPGVRVTQVHATDADGTFEHNQVTYKLANHQNLFSIDRNTGIITTLKELDRETVDVYNLKIVAIDSSPSANSNSGEHNSQERIVRIEVADENDNPPEFTQLVYTADSIPENAKLTDQVIQVNATDDDIIGVIHYSIISGDPDEIFYIEKENGKIHVNKQLVYKKHPEYNLTVLASDDKHTDTATIKISIRERSVGRIFIDKIYEILERIVTKRSFGSSTPKIN